MAIKESRNTNYVIICSAVAFIAVITIAIVFVRKKKHWKRGFFMKKIVLAVVAIIILIAGGVLVWDYNNPEARLDVMQNGGYNTPMFVTLTQNRFIKNQNISKKALEFNKSVETDYYEFLENYEKPYDVKVNVVEEDGQLIVTYFGTATKDGKEVEYLEQKSYDIDFVTDIYGSEELKK